MSNDRELQLLRKKLRKLERNQLLQERIFDRQHALLRKLNHDYEHAMATIAHQNDELARLASERELSLHEALQANEELRNTQQQLLQAKQHAEDANRSKGDFLAAMSHEIRTPLNVIIGICNLMLEDENSEETPKRIRTVRDSARHLMGLLNNVLDFSRITAGKVVLENADFNLRQEARSLLQGLKLQAEARNVTLTGDIDPHLPTWLRGDVCRLRQILLNLLDNALKFTSEGTVRLTVDLASAEEDRVLVQCKVQDSGPGIPEEIQGSIFEMFTQARGSLSRSRGGVGLGLSICAHLTQLMQGEIHVASSEGQGSIFTLTIPLGRGLEPQHKSARTTAFRSLRLLLVDDHLPNAELTMEILRKAGHETHHAAEASRALELLSSQTFDTVLMDVELPGISGVELTRRIRGGTLPGLDAQLPVIGVTAHALNDIHQRCRDAGMDDIFVKPVDYESLLGRLQALGSPDGQASPIVCTSMPPLPALYAGKMAQSIAESLEKLQLHLEHGACMQVKQEAHYLANTTAMVQAEELTAIALELEKAAVVRALSTARSIWKTLEPRLSSLHNALLLQAQSSEHP